MCPTVSRFGKRALVLDTPIILILDLIEQPRERAGFVR
jgi:hypothetical protein